LAGAAKLISRAGELALALQSFPEAAALLYARGDYFNGVSLPNKQAASQSDNALSVTAAPVHWHSEGERKRARTR
jgi:hypothetical protein